MAEIKVKKNVKRSFFEVSAPLTSTKISLYAASKDELVNKIVRLDLTRHLRGKSLELAFRILKKGEELEGEPISLILAGSFIRRMMRKGADYVEDSFVVDLKEGKAIVKPFLIARNKVSRGIRSSLRETAKKYLTDYLKTRDVRELFSEIISNKIQKDLSLKLKKVYPLALCEIRVFELIENKK
jgi:ribosomal protein S3AE